ncbi:hypothetical protein CTAYLR_003249 [Chrysophaeum taylorii]|uniref:Uncharacterized protein n=1 Tax=Chrysophaeum taylorii TaxID=2483200 RepID=A0AAD7XH44_9STRA|nr:hypothetical protein CTAYLR_003249 [Chrysophaeum taylorii]
MRRVLVFAATVRCLVGFAPVSPGGRRVSTARGAAPAMLVGAPKPEDSFSDVAKESGAAAELMSKIPPKLGDVASKSAVVAGAMASLALAPGSILVGGIAALVGGGLTRVTIAPFLVEGRYKSLQYKIATLLDKLGSDWTRVTKGEVSTIVKSWGLPDEYNVALLSQIYARYVIEVMRLPDLKLSEMNQISKLKDVLGLDDEAAGNAHYQAAVEVYRELQWVDTATMEDPESVEYQRISKLVFLCRSVFLGATDEAVDYEMGRVRSAFAMTYAEMLERCDGVAAPFYEDAVQSVVNNLDAGVDFEILAKLQTKLGFSGAKAREIHSNFYQNEVVALLEEGVPDVLSDDDVARLATLARALSMDEDTAAFVSADITKPRMAKLVRSTIVDDMEADAVTPTEAASLVVQARKHLGLSRDDAEELLRECLRERFAKHLINSVSSADLRPRQETAAYLRTMVTFKQGVDAILTTLATIDYDDIKSFRDLLLGEIALEISQTPPGERAELLQIAIRSNIEDGDDLDLSFLKSLLALDDGAADMTYRTIVEPEIDTLVDPMIANAEYDKQALDDYVKATVFPDYLYREYALKKYDEQLRQFGAENPVITIERREQLDKLQQFFGLTAADVKPVIKDLSYPVYKKSIVEAMGSSGGGIIIEEYREGLKALRVRLGIEEQDALEAMRDAAAEMMVPMIQSITTAFEESVLTKEQLAEKRGTDMGEDIFADGSGELGITQQSSSDGVLREICALVDFYEGNALRDNEITAASSYIAGKKMDDGFKSEIFKQALIFYLTNQNDRYKHALDVFPKMIDLDDFRVQDIRKDIGREVAINYGRQALETKPSLDAQDLAFINKIADELGVELDDVAVEAKRLTLRERLKKLREPEKEVEEIASIRDAAIAMGLDISVDMMMDDEMKNELFRAEAKALIVGEVDARATSPSDAKSNDDLMEAVSELQDAYGIQSETAVIKICADLADAELESAQANWVGGRKQQMTANLDRLVLVAQITGPDQIRQAMSSKIRADKFNEQLIPPYTMARGDVRDRTDTLKLILAQDEQPSEEEEGEKVPEPAPAA